ncbi:MAG: DNRLRE domain-containing protein [Polyangia bacterium]|nr:DNRLRE domain-containing protein [Polyangia bacterium]
MTFALALVAMGSSPARADWQCDTVEGFNLEMSAQGSFATSVTVTYTLSGANPADYFNTKACLAQLRDTRCALGADAAIKLYGPADPPNAAHPSGTLKFEYGDACCGQAICDEGWADPNPSEVIFVDGSEVCQVTVTLDPLEYGYSITCGGATYTALGQNTDSIGVTQVEILRYALSGGGYTWEMPNATAANAQVCYEAAEGPLQSVTVPVLEDVTASMGSPDAVYADITDLSVGAGDSEIYLKFQVPAIWGRITAATLSLRAGDYSSAEGDGADLRVVPDSSWSEATLTWNSRPSASGALLGRVGPVSQNQWSSVEVTSALTGAGPLSIALVPAPTDLNSAHFQSKEASAANAPFLRISYEVVDGDGDGVPDGPDCDDSDPDRHPGAVELCNGLDDDCDGLVDEGCPCSNGDTRACGTEEGACVAGVETCAAGEWGPCLGGVGPVAEICADGLDNDCDGVVDNGCTAADGGPDDPGHPPIRTGCSSCSAGDSLGPVALIPLLAFFGLVLGAFGRRRGKGRSRGATR